MGLGRTTNDFIQLQKLFYPAVDNSQTLQSAWWTEKLFCIFKLQKKKNKKKHFKWTWYLDQNHPIVSVYMSHSKWNGKCTLSSVLTHQFPQQSTVSHTFKHCCRYNNQRGSHSRKHSHTNGCDVRSSVGFNILP